MPDTTITHMSDLRLHGATYAEARRSVAGLEQLTRGAYAPTAGLTDEQKHLIRARAILREVGEVTTSHITAALAWDLPIGSADVARVHLSPLESRRGKPKRGPGYHMHTCPVGADELAPLEGLAVTCALRTVLDCARMLDPDWGVAIADDALHRRLITTDQLARAAPQVRRLKGAHRARALPLLASSLAESPGETLLRLRLVRMGLAPQEQVQMPWVQGNPRVDFLIDGWLVVEFDGRGKYELDGDAAAAHWAEKLRHDRLTEAGYTVLHVTWRDLWDETALAERIHRARRRGPQRG